LKKYSGSKQLIKNVSDFLRIEKVPTILPPKKGSLFYGWGRKKSGWEAVALAKKYHGSYRLLEDGFIRSIGLGVDGVPSFSLVEDDEGIYYDATAPSRLEKILATHNFSGDKNLMEMTREAISLIQRYKISKYNNSSLNLPSTLKREKSRVLIVAQTARDASLVYGMASEDPQKMIREALEENQGSEVFLKIHPDVLSGKKKSNVDMSFAKKYCTVITEEIHPVVLLDAFERVYTQTSQMGFEALLCGKKVHLYGLPFYAGWDVPNLILELGNDEAVRTTLSRRGRSLSVEEVFAGAYILYTRYYNPYKRKESDILDTITEIVMQRNGKSSLELMAR